MGNGENPPPYSESPSMPPPPPGFVQSSPYPTTSQPYPQMSQPYSQPYTNAYGQPTVVNVGIPNSHQVLVVGACPTCRVGILEERFTCLGICCCIFFFPLGLICLFTMRQKMCINCGAHY